MRKLLLALMANPLAIERIRLFQRYASNEVPMVFPSLHDLVEVEPTQSTTVYWYEQAIAHLQRKHYPQAANCFQKVLANCCNHFETWYGYGDALANMKQYGSALHAFDQAIALCPSNAAAWIFRAVVLIHLERYSDAVLSCDKALALEPRNEEAWLFRGAALNHLHHYKDSYQSYDSALGLVRPSFWQNLFNRLLPAIA